MIYNILVSDRKQVVRRLEELAGKRAEYTRVPRMAYIVEGIAVEREGSQHRDDRNADHRGADPG